MSDEENAAMRDVTIGATVDFMDATACRYRGRVIDIRGGVPFAAVLGYPFLFPLTRITPEQADFVLEQAAGVPTHDPA